DDTETFKILSWGIIDLASGQKQTCKFIIRGGVACNKSATRIVKINNDNIDHYCTAHIKKAELVTKNVNIVWSPIKLVDVATCKLCDKYGAFVCNILDGQYCKRHQKTASNSNSFMCTFKKCNN